MLYNCRPQYFYLPFNFIHVLHLKLVNASIKHLTIFLPKSEAFKFIQEYQLLHHVPAIHGIEFSLPLSTHQSLCVKPPQPRARARVRVCVCRVQFEK